MKCGSKWNAAPGPVSPYNECISIHTILWLSLQSMQFWDPNHFILVILFIILKGLSLIRLIRTVDNIIHSFSFTSVLATVVSCIVNKLVCLLICATITWQLFLNHCCTQSFFKIVFIVSVHEFLQHFVQLTRLNVALLLSSTVMLASSLC